LKDVEKLLTIGAMEELNDVVAENLSNLRKNKKLTQQELADQIGYSDKSISKWELGKAIPTVDILKKFAEFYGVSVDSLLQKDGAQAQFHSNVNRANFHNQIIIIALAATFIWFTAGCIYANGLITNTYADSVWISFIWAIPVTFGVCAALIRFFWKRCFSFFLFASLFVWTLVLAFCIQFAYVNVPHQQLWFILLVCIPLQISLILFARLK
jgi:transcriptional regulator with XRE-family HTH domain